jgi:2-dehydropantoate 2-reductase
MNRQVPTSYYLLIGRGRLATHLAAYFDLKNISYLQWSRIDSLDDLQKFILISRRIFLAISDDAIEPFIKSHQLPREKTIHFSGALSTPFAYQLHPLMTFAKQVYDLETYESLSFVSPEGTPTLSELIPELSNKHYFIPEGREAFYHALCVLAGNGTTLLWQTAMEQFQKTLGLPPEAVWPYLEQIVSNLQKNPHTALTGPWARNDQKTILKNERALASSALGSLYHSFQGVYHEDRT